MEADKVGQLYEKFGKPLLSLAWKNTGDIHVSEDAVQMVFEKVLRNHESIDDSVDRMVYGLLRRMTLNAISDIYQKRKRTVVVSDIHAEIHAKDEGFEEDVLSQMLKKEFLNDVKDAIGKLSDTYRIPLMLRVVNNYSNEQIAKALNIELGNVYIRIHRAKNELKKLLKKEGKL